MLTGDFWVQQHASAAKGKPAKGFSHTWLGDNQWGRVPSDFWTGKSDALCQPFHLRKMGTEAGGFSPHVSTSPTLESNIFGFVSLVFQPRLCWNTATTILVSRLTFKQTFGTLVCTSWTGGLQLGSLLMIYKLLQCSKPALYSHTPTETIECIFLSAFYTQNQLLTPVF